MGEVFQPLEMLGRKTLANAPSTLYSLVFALARPWNEKPTIKKLQVKQIPLWASFGET